MVFYSAQGLPAMLSIGPVEFLHAWTTKPRFALLVTRAAGQANTCAENCGGNRKTEE